MKLYGMPLSTRVNKVRMCAHVLGVPYLFEHINLFKKEQKEEWFLKINPFGKIPAIDDDGFYLSESHSIMRYLCEKFNNSNIYGENLKLKVKVDQFLDYVATQVDDPVNRILFNNFVAPKVGVEPSTRSVKEAVFLLETSLPILNKILSENKYLTGDEMTIADISLLATLDPLEVLEFDVSKFKHLLSWQKSMKQNAFYTHLHASYAQAMKDYMKKAL